MKKLDDRDAAIALVQELGKDIRTKEIRSEWNAGLAIRRSTDDNPSDGIEATPKQLAFLKRLRVDVPDGMTKQQASELIDDAVMVR